eukprot:scaffold43318_cov29-Prasinocladus_malaysianus.AAC.1
MEENKIEQYCLLAKGVKGRALLDLIAKATAEPGLFHFGELMDVESIRQAAIWSAKEAEGMCFNHSSQLEGSDFASGHRLLQLFAFGTWREYLGEFSLMLSSFSACPTICDKQGVNHVRRSVAA